MLRRVGFERDRVVLAHVGTHERYAPALQPRQEIQEWPLAVVERYVVEVVEDTRLAQRAQLRVDPAAAEHEFRGGRRLAQHSCHAKGAVNVARERRRHPDDVGPVGCDQVARERRERFVHERRLAVERRSERLEGRRARGQLLAVARELEVRIDALSPDVGEVVDVEAREITRLVRRAEAAERPRERVVAARRRCELREPRAFGQELAPDDPQRQARVATLQEPNRGCHRRHVAGGYAEKVCDRRRRGRASRGASAALERLGHLRHERRREQA